MSNELEHVIQSTTVAMLRTLYPDFVLNLSLNGISLNGLSQLQKAQLIAQAKREGMETGVQDLSIYLPNSVILNFEFKTSKGKQSEDQMIIQSKLNKLGHNYYIVRSSYDVFQYISQYTEIKYRQAMFDLINLSHHQGKITEQFLHFPKGTALKEVNLLLKKLYDLENL